MGAASGFSSFQLVAGMVSHDEKWTFLEKAESSSSYTSQVHCVFQKQFLQLLHMGSFIMWGLICFPAGDTELLPAQPASCCCFSVLGTVTLLHSPFSCEFGTSLLPNSWVLLGPHTYPWISNPPQRGVRKLHRSTIQC
jgi:hypothetical protein